MNKLIEAVLAILVDAGFLSKIQQNNILKQISERISLPIPDSWPLASNRYDPGYPCNGIVIGDIGQLRLMLEFYCDRAKLSFSKCYGTDYYPRPWEEFATINYANPEFMDLLLNNVEAGNNILVRRHASSIQEAMARK